MRKILVIGSGKSTSYLIKYLLDKSTQEELHIIVGDLNINNAQKLIGHHENANAIRLDVFDKSSRQEAIKQDDFVVTMLPARFNLDEA